MNCECSILLAEFFRHVYSNTNVKYGPSVTSSAATNAKRITSSFLKTQNLTVFYLALGIIYTPSHLSASLSSSLSTYYIKLLIAQLPWITSRVTIYIFPISKLISPSYRPSNWDYHIASLIAQLPRMTYRLTIWTVLIGPLFDSLPWFTYWFKKININKLAE